MKEGTMEKKGKVILGVTESDCHVVANQLIASLLRSEGYEVVNLGVCTSVKEFGEAFSEHSDSLAILVGTLNGHGLQDLSRLPEVIEKCHIEIPILLGGNLSVGSRKDPHYEKDYFRLGVTHIFKEISELLPWLDFLAHRRKKELPLANPFLWLSLKKGENQYDSELSNLAIAGND